MADPAECTSLCLGRGHSEQASTDSSPHVAYHPALMDANAYLLVLLFSGPGCLKARYHVDERVNKLIRGSPIQSEP